MSARDGRLRFTKMHGAGNDFVIVDRRGRSALDADLVRRLCDRHRGVGCDQLIVIEDAHDSDVIARYRLYNTDGGAAMQCGNGARCLAAWLARDGSFAGARALLDSPAGQVAIERDGDAFRVALGVPRFAPADVPLAFEHEADVYAVHVGAEEFRFGAVSMGNPHAVIAVDDVDTADVARIGLALQTDPAFPDSCNVGFAQVIAPDRIRLRVVERGVGETLACGSGACAAVAVLRRRDLIGSKVAVELPGGTLQVDWPAPDAPVTLGGPVAFVFEGELIA